MRNIFAYLLGFALLLCSCSVESEPQDNFPPIYPDYLFVTVPPNMAPLNFKVEGASRVRVRINGTMCAKGPYAEFRRGVWKKLTEESDTLKVEVCAKVDGKWMEYLPFDIYVSRDSIDASLVYRRIDPGYELYAKMGIYQRELNSFKERAVYVNNSVGVGCVNCHSFAKGNPENMQLHFRGQNGGSLIAVAGESAVFNMKNGLTLGTVYPYWHPDGRYIAYSVNDIRQSFHNLPGKVLEVYDLASDIAVFDASERELLVYPILQDSTRFETFPAFSADGKTLYFCSAPSTRDFGNIHYGLYSIDFDSESAGVGDEIVPVWCSDGKSASFPRPSYDGKYLMFTVSDFGNFSIWHPEADLYMIDLQDGSVRPLEELNSSDTESYHSWSTGSKWIVFSSRREDGRHTRLYFSHIDPEGRWSKPFLLPQKNPDRNTELLQSYNIPEFCNGNVEVDAKRIASGSRLPIEAREILPEKPSGRR